MKCESCQGYGGKWTGVVLLGTGVWHDCVGCMKLIDLWTRCVFKRDGGLCQKCLSEGKITYATDAHHIIHKDSKKHGFLRYRIDNGVSLCRACHDQDAQGTLKEWCIEWMGEEEYYELKRLGHESIGKPFDEVAVRRELVNFLNMEV